MKLLTDTWRQLVQRRLWPVALLLLGALVAVPFVLGKSPEPSAPVATAAAPAEGGAKATAASADPIVSMVSDDDSASTRRSLGLRHNPFASSAPKHKAKKTKSSTSDDTAKAEPTPSADAPANSGGGTSAPTTPTAPAVPTRTVRAGSIVVRFGASDGTDLARRTLERDDPLPDSEDPGLVFTGLKNNGKTAVFLLMEGLQADGDGTCRPAITCETLELQVGDTEFFTHESDPDGTQFELDLVKIYKHDTKVPATDEDSSSVSGTGSGSTGATG